MRKFVVPCIPTIWLHKRIYCLQHGLRPTWNRPLSPHLSPSPSIHGWGLLPCLFCDLAVKGEIWVAEVEHHIVAFVVVIKEEQCLSQIFVNPEYQNYGIGSALLNKAKEICPQGLTLQTLQQNTRACLFYEKHGFKAGKLTVNKINGQLNIEYHWKFET